MAIRRSLTGTVQTDFAIAERAAGVRYVCDEHGNYLPLSWLIKFPPVEEPGTVQGEKTLAV